MTNRPFFLHTTLTALVALSVLSSVHAQNRSTMKQRPLVVVELFQSQGCSSCPPAEENLNALADDPHVLALSFGVTYWDGLGWKDTFATDAYTDRQWSYARYHHRDTVWTPQVYVNGHVDVVGNNRAELNEVIREARSDGPAIMWPAVDRVQVMASAQYGQDSDVWLVRYDPRTLHIRIGGGENGGRTLDQRNVVRELIHLGKWKGNDVTFSLPPSVMPGLNTAVLVQIPNGGDILNASVQHVGDSNML
jgi:hypothetical protein